MGKTSKVSQVLYKRDGVTYIQFRKNGRIKSTKVYQGKIKQRYKNLHYSSHTKQTALKYRETRKPKIKAQKLDINPVPRKVITRGAKTEGLYKFNVSGSIKEIRKSPISKKAKIQAVVEFEYKGEHFTGYSKLKNLGSRTSDESLVKSARGQAIKNWNYENPDKKIKYDEAGKIKIKKGRLLDF